MNQFLKAIILVIMLGATAKADFIVSIGETAAMPTFTAGSTGTISVYGRHNEASPISLQGFTLALDFAPVGAPNGLGLPAGISGPFVGANSASSGAPVTVSTPSNRNNFDILVSSSFPGTPVNMAPLTTFKLFDVSFAISSSAAPGVYGLFLNLDGTVGLGAIGVNDVTTLLAGNPNSYGNANFGAGDLATTASGFQNQFTITAVPEPGTMVLVGLMAAGGGAVRFVRRRRAVR